MADMYDQEVWVRYVHVEDHVGQWVTYKPRSVHINAAFMGDSGNQPYSAGSDYTFEVAFLFKNSSGTWSGFDLTGVTEITFTVVTTRGVAVTTRTLTGGHITVLSQTTDHADGGTRGHIRIAFADTDSPTLGEHNADCQVTYSNGEIAEHFSGKFEVL